MAGSGRTPTSTASGAGDDGDDGDKGRGHKKLALSGDGRRETTSSNKSVTRQSANEARKAGKAVDLREGLEYERSAVTVKKEKDAAEEEKKAAEAAAEEKDAADEGVKAGDEGDDAGEAIEIVAGECLEMVGGRPGSRSLKMEGLVGWNNLPMELLLQIVGDQHNVIVASAVCTSWRDALRSGLTSLSLSWCKNNMSSLIQSLAPRFIRLQVLNLRNNYGPQLEDSAVETVANHCHDLKDLDLSKSLRLTDRSLHALAHGCPRITKLNISGCLSFSDIALTYLAGFCRRLKHLKLCGCVRAASNLALQAIARNCSELQSLNLGWCEKVGDEGITSLAAGCPNLQELDLCGCFRITDESVVALANLCPHLQSLSLYDCQNITDRAMYSLAGSASYERGLMKLNISRCTALTQPAVQAVCDSFPALHTCSGRHSLIVSGCLSLTVHCTCTVQAHREGQDTPFQKAADEKNALAEALPDVPVNTIEGAKGSFEDLKRPFKELKDMDIEEVAAEIAKKENAQQEEP